MWSYYLSLVRSIPGSFRSGLETWIFWISIAWPLFVPLWPTGTPLPTYPAWLNFLPLMFALLYAIVRANFLKAQGALDRLAELEGANREKRPYVAPIKVGFYRRQQVAVDDQTQTRTALRLKLDFENRGSRPASGWSLRLVFIAKTLQASPFVDLTNEIADEVVPGVPVAWESGNLQSGPEGPFEPFYLICEGRYEDSWSRERFTQRWHFKWKGMQGDVMPTNLESVTASEVRQITRYLEHHPLPAQSPSAHDVMDT